MKHHFIIISLLLFSISFQAQSDFESGYYIKTNGDKVEGLIKASMRNSNPKVITFKDSDAAAEQTILLKNMNGFGIGNSVQYDKFKVKISKASDNMANIDRVREFDLVEETALLELLVDGDVQLYKYASDGVTQFIIKKDDLLTTLLYKKYLVSGGVTENNRFKQQLINLLSCESGKLPDVRNLSYSERSLKPYVRKYNMCKGNLNTTFENVDEENMLSIKLFGGVQSSGLSVETNDDRSFDYGSQISFIPGVEFEVKFPINSKDKLSVFLDARYHSFEESMVYDVFTPFNSDTVILRETTGSYSAIDLGLGARYYLGLSEESRLFFGFNGSIDFYSDTLFEYDGPGEADISGRSPAIVVGVGVGYNWKHISAEARYYTNRNTISGFVTNESDYSNIAFMLSYSLFNIKL